MPTIHQIRGALLEECLLSLLRATGYRTVVVAHGDDCLQIHAAGIGVRGRGCLHQIDAIADHVVAHPFSNPQRLLVEAKNYSDHRSVGIDTIRNAVGVLKDVSEFLPPTRPNGPVRHRYHYQYAVFAASQFSSEAQSFAFAHDVYLLQLSTHSRMRVVLDAINTFAATLHVDNRGVVADVDLGALRAQVRERLQPGLPVLADRLGTYAVDAVVTAAEDVGSSVVAVIARSFPVLLTPEAPGILQRLKSEADVSLRIDRRNRQQWSIWRDDRRLFSFEVPDELFRQYMVAGAFDQGRALAVKAEYFREMQFVHVRNGAPRLITLRLDPQWLATVRARVG
jgi:hypothetical protein